MLIFSHRLGAMNNRTTIVHGTLVLLFLRGEFKFIKNLSYLVIGDENDKWFAFLLVKLVVMDLYNLLNEKR